MLGRNWTSGRMKDPETAQALANEQRTFPIRLKSHIRGLCSGTHG